MNEVTGFGEIRLALAGDRVAHKGGGKLVGYEWWQARGFDASFELLDSAGKPTTAAGELSFLIHRRPRPLLRLRSFAPDRSGVDAARAQAANQRPIGDYVFSTLRVAAADASSTSAAPIQYHEERPVLEWPVGTQSLATFRVTAWFAPDDAPMIFAERDIDLFWADADPPADPVGMARPGSSTA